MIQRLFATWLICAGILFAVLRSPAPTGPDAPAPAIAQTQVTPAPMMTVANTCASGLRLTLASNPAALWQSPAAGRHDSHVGPYREGLNSDLPCGNRRLAAAR
jgi:hypothetical protein